MAKEGRRGSIGIGIPKGCEWKSLMKLFQIHRIDLSGGALVITLKLSWLANAERFAHDPD